MATEHPLSFFIRLVETDKFDSIKGEFYAGAHSSLYDETNQKAFDLEKEWRLVTFMDEVQEWHEFNEYFEVYLATILQEQRVLAIEQLELLLIQEPDIKRMEVKYIGMISAINIYTDKANDFEDFKRYPVILECYKQLQEYLNMKALSIGMITSKRTKLTIKKESGFKLQWTDTAQAISTLFYKLCYEHNNNGKPFIIAKGKSDIVSLIEDNFVTEDGESFDRVTISDSMKANKVESRPLLTDGIGNIIKEISPQPEKGTR